MAGLRMLPLGVGDAFTARYYSQCLALEAEGRWILVDCPHPIRKMMREGGAAAGLDLDSDMIEAVVLTHLHADHCSGLEGYGYFSYFALQRKARLVAHPMVTARLWDGHLAAGMECLLSRGEAAPREKRFEDYFEHVALDLGGPVRVGPFSIECRRTIHHIPTTALRITAGGRTLGISADTDFDPTLIEWLAAADLVVHETNLGIHTPYEKLCALPGEIKGKMRLIHYTDHFEVLESEIEPLVQGQVYAV